MKTLTVIAIGALPHRWEAIPEWMDYVPMGLEEEPAMQAHIAAVLCATPYVLVLEDWEFYSLSALEKLVGALQAQPTAAGAYGWTRHVDEDWQPLSLGANWKLPFNFWNTLHNPTSNLSPVMYPLPVFQEIVAHGLEHPSAYSYLHRATAAMISDLVAVPGAECQVVRLVNEAQPAAVQYVKDIAYSCSQCRQRLGMDKPEPRRSRPVATGAIRRSCCGN